MVGAAFVAAVVAVEAAVFVIGTMVVVAVVAVVVAEAAVVVEPHLATQAHEEVPGMVLHHQDSCLQNLRNCVAEAKTVFQQVARQLESLVHLVASVKMVDAFVVVAVGVGEDFVKGVVESVGAASASVLNFEGDALATEEEVQLKMVWMLLRQGCCALQMQQMN
jgi:hypothetical protein